MARYLTGKLGQYLLVLFAAVTINFALPRLLPGSPIVLLAGEDAQNLSPEQRSKILEEVGLDRPVHDQYVRYLQSIGRLEFGYSYHWKKPITTLLQERLPWTVLLTGLSLVISAAIGTALGAFAARRHGRPLDVGLLGLLIGSESLPTFWVGMVLIALFSTQLGLLPAFGAITPWARYQGTAYLADVASHLILPLTTLVIVQIGRYFLIMRSSMIDVLGEDYVRAARAKGLSERGVLFRHAVPNALLPVFTSFMLGLGFAVSGATVVETVFSYPGVGRLIYEAVVSRDYPVLQAGFLIITLSVVAAGILADLAYPFLDPRVRAR